MPESSETVSQRIIPFKLNPKQEASYWSRVSKTGSDECWKWNPGTPLKPGKYGSFRVGKTTISAHRVSWMMQNNRLLESDIYVCHTCDNTHCVNPSHLFPGTALDNALDKVRKGRSYRPHGKLTPWAVLDESKISEIRGKFIPYTYTIAMLAKEYGVSKGAICGVLYANTWKHLGIKKKTLRQGVGKAIDLIERFTIPD